ncbi:hypothetical protein C9374_002176 [Naegleria lovaniensis]|uniref:RCC1-like domain-containing protein n=1 Tax=Naegleria lovaniensis TaxID=51637 RepID=A0AA88GWD4_NAELO|nr:uncharacterized protein C9374_002176 [Naegleria lovaniensis]KAG2387141.1 hypothetical protein C9374_002176 [Naegleria lovaniensis]
MTTARATLPSFAPTGKMFSSVVMMMALLFALVIATGYVHVASQAPSSTSFTQYVISLMFMIQKRASLMSIKQDFLTKRSAVQYSQRINSNTQSAMAMSKPYVTKLGLNQQQYDALLEAKIKQADKSNQDLYEANSYVNVTENAILVTNENIELINQNLTSVLLSYHKWQTTEQHLISGNMSIQPVNGYMESYTTFMPVLRIRNRISAGAGHGLFIGPNGRVYSWGVDTGGSLGREATKSQPFPSLSTPTDLPANLTIQQIASTYYGNLILSEDAVYDWGKNDYGLAADGTILNRKVPTKVFSWDLQGPKRIDQIAAGAFNYFAVDENGKLYSWGRNDRGQLGDRTTIDKWRPVDVYMKGSLVNQTVVKVCAGQLHTTVLTSLGQVHTFGDNTFGQLGIGRSGSDKPFIMEAANVVMNGSLASKTVVDIQCGDFHNLLLTADGKVYGWGLNNKGQIGDGSIAARLFPVQIPDYSFDNRRIISIIADMNVSFAIAENGPLYAWGQNDNYQLGVNASSYVTTPQTVSLPAGLAPVELVMMEKSTIMLATDGNFYGTGYSSSNAELLNVTTPQTNFSLVYAFPKQYLPLERRHYPYIELNDISYSFVGRHFFSFPDNGFDAFVRNNTSPEYWKMLDYHNATRKIFQGSIYNTHVLRANNYVYMFGGIVNGSISNVIYRAPIDNIENGWETVKQTLPYAVASGMSILLDDYYYIFGGLVFWQDQAGFVNISATSSILRCHVSSPTQWEVMKSGSLPKGVYSGNIARIDDYVYIFGGRVSTGDAYADILRAPYLNVSQWINTYAVLPFPIADGPMVITDDNIYIFGGYISENTPDVLGKYIKRVCVTTKKDPVGMWTVSGDDLPTVPAHLAVTTSVVVDNNLYLYGYDSTKPTTTHIQDKLVNSFVRIPFV